MNPLPADLAVALIETIVAENIERHNANAAQPYVPEIYAAHEQRIYRLVAALADGNAALEDRFNDALFDMTFDGVTWVTEAFHRIKAEVLP